jgi:predicted negative regulator of RcsB-dependent stress response
LEQKYQRLLFLFAGIGIGALIVSGWDMYQNKVAREQASAAVNAPPTGDTLRALTGHAPLPPQ